MTDAPLIYLIAGEPSGDLLGARLMAALTRQSGGRIRFAGIGGEEMRAAGLESLFPQADLAVMGLVEVLPRLPVILKRLRQTFADIAARAPVAVVTIDSWGFCGRIQAGLKQRGLPCRRIHYVAPMVWAWKAGRTRTLARCLDLLLTLLPDEPAWFEREGLRALHVGHPVIESAIGESDPAAFRAAAGFTPDQRLLCLLPGSRRSETSRLLPVFGATVERLAQTHPDLALVVPTVETVAGAVESATASWALPARLVRGRDQRYAAFAAADAALAASGTVALELAMARVPSVIAYRVSPLSAFVATRFLGLDLRFVSLVNILAGRAVMPERLQDACTPEALHAALLPLLEDPAAIAAQRAGAAEALARLGLGSGLSPSDRAAEAILTEIGAKA